MSGFTIESIDPIGGILEVWDGKSWTAPGKHANEKATVLYWVPDTDEFAVGDTVDIIIRKRDTQGEPDNDIQPIT